MNCGYNTKICLGEEIFILEIFSKLFFQTPKVILTHACYLFTYAISGVPEEINSELPYIVHMSPTFADRVAIRGEDLLDSCMRLDLMCGMYTKFLQALNFREDSV
jgi:hypothetical protein